MSVPATNVANVYPGALSVPARAGDRVVPAGLDGVAVVEHAAVPETTAEVSPPTKPLIA